MKSVISKFTSAPKPCGTSRAFTSSLTYIFPLFTWKVYLPFFYHNFFAFFYLVFERSDAWSNDFHSSVCFFKSEESPINVPFWVGTALSKFSYHVAQKLKHKIIRMQWGSPRHLEGGPKLSSFSSYCLPSNKTVMSPLKSTKAYTLIPSKCSFFSKWLDKRYPLMAVPQ